MQRKKVLVIEDDFFTCKSIAVTFRRAGATIRSTSDGNEGLRMFHQFNPDLITMDILMPPSDGWETYRQIRKFTDTPIIMLTGLKDQVTEVQALEMEAVDFVTKPFRPEVLLARARKALRKSEAAQRDSIYQDDYLEVDTDAYRVKVRGQTVRLTKTEFNLICFLIRHDGQVLTFEQILTHVWGPGYEDSQNYVHVYISRLRRKLEMGHMQPKYLLTEQGVGYRFEGID